MKVGFVGKGGVGKTTLASVVARTLARDGLRVVALDCDTNPNLGIALGLGAGETERLASLRERLGEGDAEHAPSVPEVLARFGTEGPDGIRLAVVTKIEVPEPG